MTQPHGPPAIAGPTTPLPVLMALPEAAPATAEDALTG